MFVVRGKLQQHNRPFKRLASYEDFVGILASYWSVSLAVEISLPLVHGMATE